MINFVFLSQLSHFYALTVKHSTLIYSHSCYSHRFWLPVHTLFSITSVFRVSFYRFACTYLKRKGENLFIRGRYCLFKLRVRGCFLVYKKKIKKNKTCTNRKFVSAESGPVHQIELFPFLLRQRCVSSHLRQRRKGKCLIRCIGTLSARE